MFRSTPAKPKTVNFIRSRWYWVRNKEHSSYRIYLGALLQSSRNDWSWRTWVVAALPRQAGHSYNVHIESTLFQQDGCYSTRTVDRVGATNVSLLRSLSDRTVFKWIADRRHYLGIISRRMPASRKQGTNFWTYSNRPWRILEGSSPRTFSSRQDEDVLRRVYCSSVASLPRNRRQWIDFWRVDVNSRVAVTFSYKHLWSLGL